MKCYIIVIIDEEDGNVLSTRKRFDTYQDAKDHCKGYAEYWRDKTFIIECPKGLEY